MLLLLNLVTFYGKLLVTANSMKTNWSFTLGSPVDILLAYYYLLHMEWRVAVHKKHVASYCAQISAVICVCMIVVANKIKLGEATPGCTTEFPYIT